MRVHILPRQVKPNGWATTAIILLLLAVMFATIKHQTRLLAIATDTAKSHIHGLQQSITTQSEINQTLIMLKNGSPTNAHYPPSISLEDTAQATIATELGSVDVSHITMTINDEFARFYTKQMVYVRHPVLLNFKTPDEITSLESFEQEVLAAKNQLSALRERFEYMSNCTNIPTHATLIWVDKDCTLPVGTELGSTLSPCLLIVWRGNLHMLAQVKIQGLVIVVSANPSHASPVHHHATSHIEGLVYQLDMAKPLVINSSENWYLIRRLLSLDALQTISIMGNF